MVVQLGAEQQLKDEEQADALQGEEGTKEGRPEGARLVLANEDDHAEVGRGGVKEEHRAEGRPPGEGGGGQQFDSEEKATGGEGKQKEEDLKGGGVDEPGQLVPGVEHLYGDEC